MAVCSPDFATQEYETTYFQDHRRESPHIEFEVCIYNTEVYTVWLWSRQQNWVTVDLNNKTWTPCM